MTAKEIKQDIVDLNLAIKSPATPDDKKELFKNKVKELEDKLKKLADKPEPKSEPKDEDDFYKAVKKKQQPKFEPKQDLKKEEIDRKKSVPLKKSEVKDLEYDCDELIEKEKSRKAKAKERAKQPKKSEATKIKDRLGEIGDRIEDGAEDGDLTKPEILKLISECKSLLAMLQSQLAKMK